MKPVVTMDHVTKSFREATGKTIMAIENITLEIDEGEFFIFLGPSGCGKSTILRIMSGLEHDYHGKVFFYEGVTGHHTSFVFQQFAIWPWLTVSENIGIGLVARGVNHQEYKQKVDRELIRFGLTKFATAYPRELSGGMKQRVGIARALATDPKIIFMDEPFSELDSFTAAALRHELLAVWQETRPTIIMVTHLLEEVLELGDRIAVMTPRPGKIEKIIENKLPRPRAKRTKAFFALEDELYKLVSP